MTLLAGIVVVVSGSWLIGLAAATLLTPLRAERFLGGFARSARAHYTEQALRLITGLAMIVFAAEMRFSNVFVAFGWILAVTAGVLLLTPWRWHRRFGEWAIPLAIRYMKVLALGAFTLGAFILYAVFSAI